MGLGVRASRCPGPVSPGDTAEVAFELMYHPRVDYSALAPGRSFLVMEGARPVGEGIVILAVQESG
jgi:translation elongation factor EF-Tu-like GTPase